MSNGYSGYYKSFSLIAMRAFLLDTSHYILVSLIKYTPTRLTYKQKKVMFGEPEYKEIPTNFTILNSKITLQLMFL